MEIVLELEREYFCYVVVRQSGSWSTYLPFMSMSNVSLDLFDNLTTKIVNIKSSTRAKL